MTNTPVKKRRVFYIPGYDPYAPRRYRELYRRESHDQAAISGYYISQRARHGVPGYGWQVSGLIDGKPVETEIDVLVWSDLVQGSMKHTVLATYLQLITTAWIYICTGVMRRLMWLGRGPVIAAFYPIAMLLGQAVLAIAIGWILGAQVSRYTLPGVGWVVAVPAIVLILRWFCKNDRRFKAYYLMHDYAYSARLRGKTSPELEQRLAEFSTRIKTALQSDVDEVLVVGHSSGAHLGVSILAGIERNAGDLRLGPELAFLSLGQVIPMVSFLPGAGALRADLHDLSLSRAITWVDVSAPGDGCSFALCDPVAVTGVAPKNQRWPLVFSAAFSQTLSPARWQALKRRYFRLHFQYICAFDQPRDYDYFQITAGPLTLSDRYRDRAPSKSRIDVAASPYTSMVA